MAPVTPLKPKALSAVPQAPEIPPCQIRDINHNIQHKEIRIFDLEKLTFFLLILFHSFSKLIQHISIILHLSRCVFFDVVTQFPSVFDFVITLPMDEVFLTILHFFVINDPVDGVKRGFFILWYVLLMLGIIVVKFEHVSSEDRVTGVVSGDIQSEVAVFINSGNLVWSSPDGLKILSKVLREESSLVHNEVSHHKCNVCVPALLCIFELFVLGHDKFVMIYLME